MTACVDVSSSSSIFRVLVALISTNAEMVHPDGIRKLETWCQDRDLLLKASSERMRRSFLLQAGV